jgi:hypothetical protein
MSSPAGKTRLGLVEFFVRLALGGILCYAGIVKFTAPAPFAEAIHGFRLLPLPLIDPAASALPVFEVLLGAGLIAGWRRGEMAFAAALLSLLFIAVLVQAGLRGLSVECGCFGPDNRTILGRIPPLLRDAALLAAAIFLRYRAAVRLNPLDAG